uniref:ATP synthase F0 subunit 8 n=1 Tax=Apphia nigricauda TaxID=3062133 RepID=UPI00286B02D0|nr:ATP synthase F0 subunit 8 [Apphia nigricauda]WKK49898.1 ATP synthase F0 subunit 8 [Apphia nigricauda]
MPQMSPIWWLYMMLIFILCLTMVTSVIYFNYLSNNTKLNSFMSSNLIWKW